MSQLDASCPAKPWTGWTVIGCIMGPSNGRDPYPWLKIEAVGPLRPFELGERIATAGLPWDYPDHPLPAKMVVSSIHEDLQRGTVTIEAVTPPEGRL